MILDTSALVAILFREPDAELYARLIHDAERRLISRRPAREVRPQRNAKDAKRDRALRSLAGARSGSVDRRGRAAGDPAASPPSGRSRTRWSEYRNCCRSPKQKIVFKCSLSGLLYLAILMIEAANDRRLG